MHVCQRLVTPPIGDRPGRGVRLGAEQSRQLRDAGHRECSGHPLGRLLKMSADLPEPPGRGYQSQGNLGVARIDSPVEGSSQVVVVDRQAVEQHRAMDSREARRTRLCQLQIGQGVASHDLFARTAGFEPLGGIFTDGREHRESRLFGGPGYGTDETLFCQ